MNSKKNNKFYVTTPVYYVNSKPHLGTLYSTLLADVAARWNKLIGKDVFFLTGTDEHGQKLEEVAQKNGVQPKEFVDSMVPAFKKIWKLFEIDYNKFIRTTDSQHNDAVKKFLNRLQEPDDIYKAVYSGWYCVSCETYITINSELKKDEKGFYHCPSCGKQLREIEEESYFFRLSAYEDKLLKFYEGNPNFITPKERMNEVISFVKSGLKDLSISRKNVKWGIPLPWDNNYTIYVWMDALINYISAIGYGQENKKSQEEFNYLWPANLQIMAKDIIRFHAIYWPAFLMAVGLPLPKKLLVHGYILTDTGKMSKSQGNVIDPESLANLYGVESVRYYLIRQIPINQDGSFVLDDLEHRISSDLANNLGNLLNRSLSLAINNGFKRIKASQPFEAATASLRERCEEIFRIFWDEMNHYHYHLALSKLWNFISEVNAFFHEQKPWVVVKENKEYFEEIIYAVCYSLYIVGILLWPIMPKKMEELLSSIGHNFNIEDNYEEDLRKNLWNKEFILHKTDKPLFIRPEILKEKNDKKISNDISSGLEDCIDINDFARVKLIVGTILGCEPVNGSEKLYKLKVDMGQFGIKQILSGIAKFFKPEDLVGKQGVYVQNLKPRKIMGLRSQGMMLFAQDSHGLRLVTIEEKVENGTRLS